MFHYLISPEGYLAGTLDDPALCPPGHTVHSQENWVPLGEAVFNGTEVVSQPVVPWEPVEVQVDPPFLGSPLYNRAVEALEETSPLVLAFILAIVASDQGNREAKAQALQTLEALCPI